MNVQQGFCPETHSEVALVVVCSTCEDTISVARPTPGTTLLDLRCPRCGVADVYHIGTLRRVAPSTRQPEN